MDTKGLNGKLSDGKLSLDIITDRFDGKFTKSQYVNGPTGPSLYIHTHIFFEGVYRYIYECIYMYMFKSNREWTE